MLVEGREGYVLREVSDYGCVGGFNCGAVLCRAGYFVACLAGIVGFAVGGCGVLDPEGEGVELLGGDIWRIEDMVSGGEDWSFMECALVPLL